MHRWNGGVYGQHEEVDVGSSDGGWNLGHWLQRPPRQPALESTLARQRLTFRLAPDRDTSGSAATGPMATGCRAIGTSSALAARDSRRRGDWPRTGFDRHFAPNASAGSFPFCCLHHAASPNWRGRFFCAFSVFKRLTECGVTPSGSYRENQGDAESSCSFGRGDRILSSDRNKRAKMLFK